MKILVIGGGSIGKRHVRNLKALGFKEIYVLRRNSDYAFEEEFQVEILTSYAQASEKGIDCVFCCSPTSLHNESLNFAVQQQAHIFMEKPLIHNQIGLREAQRIMECYTRIFFIGFMLRYHPLVQRLKSFIKEGLLGKPYSARIEFGSYLPYWHPWEDYHISYASRSDLGGGVINTISHELDLIQYLFGNPQSLYCSARNLGQLGIEVEELCEATFEYSDKVVSLHLDYLQKDYDRNIKILFENGRAKWNWHDNFIEICQHNQDPERIYADEDFNVNQLYISELIDFFKLIESNTLTHSLDFRHAISNTELLILMHQSAKITARVDCEF